MHASFIDYSVANTLQEALAPRSGQARQRHDQRPTASETCKAQTEVARFCFGLFVAISTRQNSNKVADIYFRDFRFKKSYQSYQ